MISCITCDCLYYERNPILRVIYLWVYLISFLQTERASGWGRFGRRGQRQGEVKGQEEEGVQSESREADRKTAP